MSSRAFKNKGLHRLETSGIRARMGETEELCGLDPSRGSSRDKDLNVIAIPGDDPRKPQWGIQQGMEEGYVLRRLTLWQLELNPPAPLWESV